MAAASLNLHSNHNLKIRLPTLHSSHSRANKPQWTDVMTLVKCITRCCWYGARGLKHMAIPCHCSCFLCFVGAPQCLWQILTWPKLLCCMPACWHQRLLPEARQVGICASSVHRNICAGSKEGCRGSFTCEVVKPRMTTVLLQQKMTSLIFCNAAGELPKLLDAGHPGGFAWQSASDVSQRNI